jgi:hypothetical protein
MIAGETVEGAVGRRRRVGWVDECWATFVPRPVEWRQPAESSEVCIDTHQDREPATQTSAATQPGPPLSRCGTWGVAGMGPAEQNRNRCRRDNFGTGARA